jgi:hypothetical protein
MRMILVEGAIFVFGVVVGRMHHEPVADVPAASAGLKMYASNAIPPEIKLRAADKTTKRLAWLSFPRRSMPDANQ